MLYITKTPHASTGVFVYASLSAALNFALPVVILTPQCFDVYRQMLLLTCHLTKPWQVHDTGTGNTVASPPTGGRGPCALAGANRLPDRSNWRAPALLVAAQAAFQLHSLEVVTSLQETVMRPMQGCGYVAVGGNAHARCTVLRKPQ